MSLRRLSRWRPIAGAAFLALAVAACDNQVGARKLKAIKPGASRDAVMGVMGTGPVTKFSPTEVARVVSGFRRQIFLVNSKTYEIIWYTEDMTSVNDTILRTTHTPVMVHEDKAIGWGWKTYDSLATALGLPNPTAAGNAQPATPPNKPTKL
jgi:hypothetical protein